MGSSASSLCCWKSEKPQWIRVGMRSNTVFIGPGYFFVELINFLYCHSCGEAVDMCRCVNGNLTENETQSTGLNTVLEEPNQSRASSTVQSTGRKRKRCQRVLSAPQREQWHLQIAVAAQAIVIHQNRNWSFAITTSEEWWLAKTITSIYFLLDAAIANFVIDLQKLNL